MHRIVTAIRRSIRAALHTAQALADATRSSLYGVTAVLRWAADHGRAVTIGYRKEDGTASVRTIEPSKVWQTKAGNWAVRAHDRLRGEDRTFRIDRIVNYRAA
jgi:predicted DNA-binding transcriptional regulator YafY